MKDLRWLEDEGVDEDVRQLLRAAPVPRNMRAEERARSARALRRMTALPVAAGLMFWLKNVAIAGVLGAAGGFLVSGAVVLATNEAPAPEPAPVAPPSRGPEAVPTLRAPTPIPTNASAEEPPRAPGVR